MNRPGKPPAQSGCGVLLLLCLGPAPLWGASASLPECPALVMREGSPPNPAPPAPHGSLTLVSVNMHNETRSDVFLGGLEGHPPLRQADVYLLQEFVQDGADFLGELSRALGYHYAFGSTQECGDGCDLGLAILSRYPLRDFRVLPLPRNDLQYNQRCRIALAADVVTPSQQWALFNLHLDTRINAGRRVRQLGPILEAARSSSSPAVIAGDFNTADFLWIRSFLPLPWLQLHKRAVRKALESEGFSTPFRKTGPTFNRFPLKLDWIYLKGLRPIRFGLTRLNFTDHKALWATLEEEGRSPADSP